MNFKARYKTILLILFCLIGAIAIPRFCHHQTQGFRLTKIQSNLMSDPCFAHTTIEDKEFLKAIFQQKFAFLGRGLQSFVFASEDGEYVIKVFNNRYQRKIFLFSLLSHFPWIGHWAKERTAYYRGKLAKTFNSYQIAFSEMKEHTGLVYTHLSTTRDIPDTLTLVDKLNISHSLNPNQVGFLVQKRAKLVFPALKEYINNRDLEGAKQAISSLLHLFFWKWQNSISDNDPLIRTNYGFVAGKAVQIDVGPLSKEPGFSPDMQQHREEILRITASLKFWLTENSPELVPFLDRELEELLSSKNLSH